MDTAINTAAEALDRIKDSACSHGEAHVVKVLGRDCGYLALRSAISGDAEAVVVPEFEADQAQAEGDAAEMGGLRGDEISRTPLAEALEGRCPLDQDMYRLISVLAGLPEPEARRVQSS